MLFSISFIYFYEDSQNPITENYVAEIKPINEYNLKLILCTTYENTKYCQKLEEVICCHMSS